jgi:aminoglycoside phosphotransferase (APT) family kinase protein
MASPVAPELIPVRADELLTSRRCTPICATSSRGELPLRVEQFAGGHANLTYLLRYGEGDGAVEYVLRRPPLGPVAPGSHDMHREYRALSVLWKAFPPAPRAYFYCEDPSLIGAPFFVMERRRGIGCAALFL